MLLRIPNYAAIPMDQPTSRPRFKTTATFATRKTNTNLVPECGSDSDSDSEKPLASLTSGKNKEAMDQDNSSLMGPPSLPASAAGGKQKEAAVQDSSSFMSPPKRPASTTQAKQKELLSQNSSSSMAPPTFPASATQGTQQAAVNRKNSSSMGPPEFAASENREKRKVPLQKECSSSTLRIRCLERILDDDDHATRGRRKEDEGHNARKEPAGEEEKRYWSIKDLPVERYTDDGRRIR